MNYPRRQRQDERLEVLPATTYQPKKSRSRQNISYSGQFPDEATHLEIELSCYEDHPSSLSFANNQTVSQAQAAIMEMRRRLHSDLNVPWLMQNPSAEESGGAIKEPSHGSVKPFTNLFRTSSKASSSLQAEESRRVSPPAKSSAVGVHRQYRQKKQIRLSPILSVSYKSSPGSVRSKRPSPGAESASSHKHDPLNALGLHFGNKHVGEGTLVHPSPQPSANQHGRIAMEGTMPLRPSPLRTPRNENQQGDPEMMSTHSASAHNHHLVRLWPERVSTFFIFFNASGMIMAYGVFQVYYSEMLLQRQPTAIIAMIGSVQSSLLLGLAAPMAIASRTGCQRLCIGAGSILYIITLICMSFCQQWVSLFITQGIVLGLASGIMLHSRDHSPKGLSRDRDGLIAAIALTGSCVGGIFYALIFQQLILKVGFAWTIRCMACISTTTLIPANLLLRGQELLIKPRLPMAHRPTAVSPLIDLSGIYLCLWALGIAFFYLPLFAMKDIGSSLPQACSLLILFLAIFNISQMAFRTILMPYLGILAARLVSCFLTSFVMFWWIIVDSISAAFVLSSLLGVCGGGLSLPGSNIKLPNHSHGPDYGPMSLRLRCSILSIALLTGAPICGAMVDTGYGGFLNVQVFAGCSLLVGGVLIIIAACWKAT